MFFFMKLKASYTVENSVIIPLFTLVALALIMLGFKVSNTVTMKALAWRAGIEIGMLTAKDPDDETLGRISEELDNSIHRFGIFMGNVRTSINIEDTGKIKVNTKAEQMFDLPFFSMDKSVSADVSGRMHNPASELRKWHAAYTAFKKQQQTGDGDG